MTSRLSAALLTMTALLTAAPAPARAPAPAQFIEHTIDTDLAGGYQVVIADLNHAASRTSSRSPAGSTSSGGMRIPAGRST